MAGFDVDVTRVPARYTLEIMKLTKRGNVEFDEQLDILVQICQLTNSDVTRDYLIDKLDLAEVVELLEFIVEPVTRKLTNAKKKAGDGTEKNS